MNSDKEVLKEPHDADQLEQSGDSNSPFGIPSLPEMEHSGSQKLSQETQLDTTPLPQDQSCPQQDFPEPPFNLLALGPESVRIKCPFCRTEIITKLAKHNTSSAYLASGLFLICGCWLGCCLIPFYMDSFKVIEHYCPQCERFLGRCSRD